MHFRHGARSRGFSLVEVLITLVVLSFGLLALINLQIKMHLNEAESYQRAQAVVLLQDMANRLQVNQVNAASYVTPADSWFGVDGEDCTDYGADANDPVQIDACAWSTLLLGAAVTTSDADEIGAMIGARGCVEEIQPRDPTDGVCNPGIYRVSLAWQGLMVSAEPEEACGAGEFGDDGNRRVISTVVSLGVPGCLQAAAP